MKPAKELEKSNAFVLGGAMGTEVDAVLAEVACWQIVQAVGEVEQQCRSKPRFTFETSENISE